ncbi:NAD(P)H-binding protein [Actinoplanes sp. TBRC 11911]|uniref:NAD(P)H-binding protein n=1 Tax=Actinoplanes sp. TBRC 11911 TaxID=2729386 RepID=UPI00145CD03B|nr:NAD(P)H-binding protein [Actinoplanes sp. TBRC 11911]NMO53763.1 NAD(P)H-binding protein [Actinoplanes sp. TBRC 11911]
MDFLIVKEGTHDVTILVTGTTGTVSTEVLRGLAEADHPPVRALVRDLARVPDLPGIEFVQGDLDEPATLGDAFRGVDTLWLLSAYAAISPHQTSNALVAAREAGVSHVVRMSAIGAGHDAPTRNGRLHALSEIELRYGDFDWTIIRPFYFMQNLYGSLQGDALYGGLQDGRVAMIDAEDIGAFGAKILLDPAAHASQVYTISGPRSISLYDYAAAIGEVTGRPTKYHPLGFDEFQQMMLDAGFSSWFAGVNTEYARAYADGWGDRTTDDFPRLMGRPAHDITEFVRDHLSELRGQ